ncbi:MAG: phosphate ABC transporter permease subunit PstC [Gammaproteobacteria bacterium]|nr:phosphate ABC transporter permease subunit PstC [Gammaproteobacteria bacterium]
MKNFAAAPLQSCKKNWVRLISAVAVIVLATLALLALIYVIGESAPVFKHAGINFFLGHEWYYRDSLFGALPMIYGSLAVSLVALTVAVPIAIPASIWTAELLPVRWRSLAKGVIELLAGIPSVIYGLIAVIYLREWVYDLFSPWFLTSGDSLLTAGLILAVMILPTITTLADDALCSVPEQQRMAARGLGLNSMETILYVSLPQAAPGIFSAVVLGFGRAVGETIAVFLVVGRMDGQLPNSTGLLHSLLGTGQTLTSKLGGAELFLAYGDKLHWSAMMGLALVLLMLIGFSLITVTVTRFASAFVHHRFVATNGRLSA